MNMAKVLIKYMPSSNASGTQRSMNVTIVNEVCGTSIGSRVQENFCFLRFENYNFIGEVNKFVVNLTNPNKVSADPDVFLAAAQQLLSNLSSDIVSGSAANRFASRSIIDASGHPILALAQCWGDITLVGCKQCLSIAIESLFTDNSGSLGGRGLAGSCFVQYESNGSSNPLPPAAPPPEKSSTAAHSPPTEKSSNKIPIVLGALGGFLLLLMI